jgi:hypothetical protein
MCGISQFRDNSVSTSNALDDWAFTRHDPVKERQQPVLHPFLQLRDQLQRLLTIAQESLEGLSRNVALVAEQLAEELFDQLLDGLADHRHYRPAVLSRAVLHSPPFN